MITHAKFLDFSILKSTPKTPVDIDALLETAIENLDIACNNIGGLEDNIVDIITAAVNGEEWTQDAPDIELSVHKSVCHALWINGGEDQMSDADIQLLSNKMIEMIRVYILNSIDNQ